MRLNPAALLSIAMLSIAGPAARADDAKPPAKKTYRVLLRERWKAGDVTTRTARETMNHKLEMKRGEDAVEKAPSVERQTSYVVVAKCLEADAEGYATRFHLYLNAWSIETGPTKDSSLAGVHVEVTGVGANREWKILTPDAQPSTAALQWIEQFYGRRSASEATYADLEPACEIEVGGAWEGNARAIATRLVERGIAVDVEKAKAACTLVSVDDGKARIRVRMSFPTSEQRLLNSQALPWKEGGVLELDVDVTRPLVAGEFDANMHREQRLSGTGIGKDVTVTSEDLGLQDIEIRAGGKMPDVPGATEAPR